MRSVAPLLAIAVVTACGVAGSGAAPAPRAPAAPSPAVTQSAPSHVPGSSVRIAVDGVQVPPGASAEIAAVSGTQITLSFPFSMDRASVERWLPRVGTRTWVDDQTLLLTFGPNEEPQSFKVAEATAKDGSAIVDLFIVSLRPPASVSVTIYTPDELLAAGFQQKAPVSRLMASGGELRFSPDGRKALLTAGPVARVFDVASGLATALPTGVTPIVSAGWIGNDRVVLVGESVVVVSADGTGARIVIDAEAARSPAAARVSSRGSYVALRSQAGLAVADLATGAVRWLDTAPDRCAARGREGLAWSADERRLAAVRCDDTAARVVIFDVIASRTVRVLDGGDLGIAAFPNGELAVAQESGESGEGARTLWVRYSFDGIEKARLLGYTPSISPNGRYVVDFGCCAGGGSTLIDLQGPDDARRSLIGSFSWLRDGRVVVVSGTAGTRVGVVP